MGQGDRELPTATGEALEVLYLWKIEYIFKQDLNEDTNSKWDTRNNKTNPERTETESTDYEEIVCYHRQPQTPNGVTEINTI